MILTSIAWRNVWRSRVRSLVIITAITIGIFAGVFTFAFSLGMMNQRIESAIKTEISHIQVHHKKYQVSGELKDYIEDADAKVDEINKIPGVIKASGRVVVNAMIASAEQSMGVQITGINPENEKEVTNVYQKIIDGDYFESSRKNQIVVGKELAEKLKIKMRSKVVLRFQEMDGTLTGAAFRVTGIYNTTNTMFDERMVFVKDEDIARLVKTDVSAKQEIAIYLEDDDLSSSVKDKIQDMYPDYEAKTWTELQPDLAYMTKSMDTSLYVIMAIILLALMFGIINTMLMVVLERVKELGMLMAVGMNRLRVFSMIMLETIMLTLTGGVTGILIATGITLLTHESGIDLSVMMEGMEAYGYGTIVKPELQLEQLIVTTIMVIFTGIIAAIYPALKALRLKPVEALRTE